jgi:tRNA-(ms[2]io[6]A)-hydroxylase
VILRAATDEAWIERAGREWQLLLLDHANCEKKAASTALALIFAYPEDRALASRLSRLAREELRHFEQVDRMLERLGVPATRMAPGRYAGELRRGVSTTEPLRKLDLMLCGALIEARSCERFERLARVLPSPLGEFYGGLAAAERRHASLYVELAETAARAVAGEQGPALCAERLEPLAALEASLATSPDPEFRFHSGTPVSA